MKKKMFILAGLFLLTLSILPLISAQLTFAPDEPADIRVSCFDVGNNFCGSTTSCNLTIFYPNMTTFVDDAEMTNQINFLNYTTADLNIRGEYNAIVLCGKGTINGYSSFSFIVTNIPATSQGNVAVGILISLIGLSFLFIYIGFKFAESEKLFPIALFFILLSLVVVVYVLQLGYIYNQDILISSTTSGSQFKIYIGIMYGLIAMSFLGLLSLILKTLKEFRVRKSIQKNSDGWDTNKNIHE